MTLIVEDGSNVPNAEAYADVAYADAYFAKLGVTGWALLGEPAKEINLRKGGRYMTATYRDMWAGWRINSRNGQYVRQSMDWPREGVYVDQQQTYIPNNEIPTEVKDANCELAWRANSEDLLADTISADRVIREKVGPLETEYAAYGSTLPSYNMVMSMLDPFLKGGGGAGQMRMTRT